MLVVKHETQPVLTVSVEHASNIKVHVFTIWTPKMRKKQRVTEAINNGKVKLIRRHWEER